MGELGLLGVTVPPEYGGSGMDASAACIVHEEMSAADPACCLSYLGKCIARKTIHGQKRGPRRMYLGCWCMPGVADALLGGGKARGEEGSAADCRALCTIAHAVAQCGTVR